MLGGHLIPHSPLLTTAIAVVVHIGLFIALLKTPVRQAAAGQTCPVHSPPAPTLRTFETSPYCPLRSLCISPQNPFEPLDSYPYHPFEPSQDQPTDTYPCHPFEPSQILPSDSCNYHPFELCQNHNNDEAVTPSTTSNSHYSLSQSFRPDLQLCSAQTCYIQSSPSHSGIPPLQPPFLSSSSSATRSYRSQQLWVRSCRQFLHLLCTSSTSTTTPPTSFASLALRHYATSTIKLYASALSRFINWYLQSYPHYGTDTQLSEALQHYFVFLISSAYPSSARILLASLRLASSVCNIAFSPSQTYWAAADSLYSLAQHRPRCWFCITWLSSDAATNLPLPHYGACLIAFIYLLRYSELSHLTYNDLTPFSICLEVSKGRREPIWRSATPFIAAWLCFFMQHPQLLPMRSPTIVRFARLIAQDHGCSFTWHAFRRGAASCLSALGSPHPIIALWGRWRSLRCVHHYIEQSTPLPPPPDEVTLLDPAGASIKLPTRCLWPDWLFSHPTTTSSTAVSYSVAPSNSAISTSFIPSPHYDHSFHYNPTSASSCFCLSTLASSPGTACLHPGRNLLHSPCPPATLPSEPRKRPRVDGGRENSHGDMEEI